METKTQEERSSEKDTITIAVLIGIGIVVFMWFFSSILGLAVIPLVGGSLAVGSVGRQRKIGFGPAYYLSLFCSPIVGLIFTLISPRLNDEGYKGKMFDAASKYSTSTPTYVADELRKLSELRKDGTLTEEEFHAQKEKLLSL